MALKIDEFFARIQAAPPAERWKVAAALNKRMRNQERRLAASEVGDFIIALGDDEPDATPSP